jgi:hypothetical protein
MWLSPAPLVVVTRQVHDGDQDDPLRIADAPVDDAEGEPMRSTTPMHVVELLPGPRGSE